MTGRKTVLVVDDEWDLQELISIVLRQEGYGVARAADGGDALKSVERSMPDLILLDMKMPGVDGWSFASEFRKKHGFHVPIVVLTASEDAKESADEIGANDWLGKPFDLDRLVSTVRRVIGPAQMDGQALA
ncbi:MAG: response regulator [Chloroflexota bacterium]|jgi:chemosensory pili system protein ChpA (sensor histidine kinase/response regulator)